MIEVARVEHMSEAGARRYFETWCDLPTHPEWSAGMEYLRLAEPFGLGARGHLKTRTGPPAEFVVTELIDGSVYADTTILDEAELTVRHEAVETAQGTRIVLTATLSGPQERSWAVRMGDGVQRDLEADLASLTLLLESESA
jgi:hypothetical protein